MGAREIRQERGVERRAAILRGAVDLLLSERMSAVTHRSVAERAGVPVASIRYYFATREDLLDAALREVDARRHRTAVDVVVAEDVEMVDRVLRTYLGDAVDDRTLRATIGWIADAPRESPRLAATLAELWPAIELDVAAALSTSGASSDLAAMCTRVVDGALLVAVAGDRSDLYRAAWSALAEVLELPRRPD